MINFAIILHSCPPRHVGMALQRSCSHAAGNAVPETEAHRCHPTAVRVPVHGHPRLPQLLGGVTFRGQPVGAGAPNSWLASPPVASRGTPRRCTRVSRMATVPTIAPTDGSLFIHRRTQWHTSQGRSPSTAAHASGGGSWGGRFYCSAPRSRGR